ncbi:tripartite tricarboxylate transporter substrate-binding protein [Frigidibacter sp. MR17.14]|uniref:Bug family tripartite tricarboxylate transporter substrate binding protein n=1 Tax=Frigidibacter sp. MR17.14 TaxID=3126509 RepID=UPI00301305D8
MKINLASAMFAAATALVALPQAVAAQGFTPKNPECIAPSAPGGGWDFICRETAKFLFEMGEIKQAMQVVNLTGGGGGVAYANVTKERDSDDNLIVAASNGTTSRLAQGAYPGSSPDDVHWLGTFGAEYGAIAVSKDSPYKTLKELMDAVKADPRSVAFAGGSAVGGYDHIKPLLLGKAAGVEDVRQMKYVAFSGGGEAITSLLSGSVQAVSGDFSEIRGFVESGDIRILGIMSPERLKSFPDVPTGREQGYDVIGANWRGLYIPKNASPEAKEFWTNAIKKMADSGPFQEMLVNASIEPFENFGPDMDAFVAQNIKEITDISREIGIIK